MNDEILLPLQEDINDLIYAKTELGAHVMENTSMLVFNKTVKEIVETLENEYRTTEFESNSPDGSYGNIYIDDPVDNTIVTNIDGGKGRNIFYCEHIHVDTDEYRFSDNCNVKEAFDITENNNVVYLSLGQGTEAINIFKHLAQSLSSENCKCFINENDCGDDVYKPE